MSQIVEAASVDDRAGRKRRQRRFAVLASGWLALMVALVLEPCCDAFAAGPAEHHAVDAGAHGDHAPAPCDPWLAPHLDLNGPAPVPLAGGSDVKTPAYAPVALAPAVAVRVLPPDAPVQGPDPPRPIYLTLARLLM